MTRKLNIYGGTNVTKLKNKCHNKNGIIKWIAKHYNSSVLMGGTLIPKPMHLNGRYDVINKSFGIDFMSSFLCMRFYVTGILIRLVLNHR